VQATLNDAHTPTWTTVGTLVAQVADWATFPTRTRAASSPA